MSATDKNPFDEIYATDVMVMGVGSVIGLAVYGRFINPDQARRTETAAE